MVERVIEAIGESIWQKTEGKINVYTEKVSQGLKMPCAFAECERVEKVPLLGGRHFFRIHALITLDERGERGRHEAEGMLNDVLGAMSVIELDGAKIRGRQIKADRQKDSLLIRGVYDVFVSFNEDKDLMESIEVKWE